jgi:hypothetical protein
VAYSLALIPLVSSSDPIPLLYRSRMGLRLSAISLVLSNRLRLAYAISGVPVMVNVMYLYHHQHLPGSQWPFMFGSTLDFEPFNFMGSDEFLERKRQAAAWRRETVLRPELSRLPTTATLPLDEHDVDALVERLHQLFSGVLKSWSETKEARFHTLFGKEGAATYRETSFMAAGKEQYMPFMPRVLLGRKLTGSALRPQLEG